mmetsp:Transcript_12977/g.36531  ORF Transcript_12977/g.36531 Transcript_12977/m.36531 type:complete len:118 (+) Transcript_12977:1880-2233(+)
MMYPSCWHLILADDATFRALEAVWSGRMGQHGRWDRLAPAVAQGPASEPAMGSGVSRTPLEELVRRMRACEQTENDRILKEDDPECGEGNEFDDRGELGPDRSLSSEIVAEAASKEL